jgi:hypothetical protein
LDECRRTVRPETPVRKGVLTPSVAASAKSQDHDYALALLQWERGAQAGPADYHHYWVAAATDAKKH